MRDRGNEIARDVTQRALRTLYSQNTPRICEALLNLFRNNPPDYRCTLFSSENNNAA